MSGGDAPDRGGCLWCGRPLPPRQHSRGSPQRFCSAGCRAAFWTAARRWVHEAVAGGLLTAAGLKAPERSVLAFLEAFRASDVPAANGQKERA